MDDTPNDDPLEPTPIPLGLREDWKGLHGTARVDDCAYWLRGRSIMVRRDGEDAAWRDLNAGDLDRLHRAGYITHDVRVRMQIRILT